MRLTIFKTIFLIFIAISFNGCIALTPLKAVAGPLIDAYVIWRDGEAHKFYYYDSKVVYRAARRASIKMDMEIEKTLPPNKKDYKFVAGGNNKFKIHIEHYDLNITRLNVRINFLGDKQFAELFYSLVDKELNRIDYLPTGRPGNLDEIGTLKEILKL